jgi:hypothetical protein
MRRLRIGSISPRPTRSRVIKPLTHLAALPHSHRIGTLWACESGCHFQNNSCFSKVGQCLGSSAWPKWSRNCAYGKGGVENPVRGSGIHYLYKGSYLKRGYVNVPVGRHARQELAFSKVLERAVYESGCHLLCHQAAIVKWLVFPL